MVPSFAWLIVAFITGVLCCALLLWTLRRFGPKTGRLAGLRVKPLNVKEQDRSGEMVPTPDKLNEIMREISGSTGQMTNMVGKVCSLLQEERDDREALLRLIDQRSQEVLQLLGQAAYHLETQAQLSRELRPSLGVGGTNPISKQRATETAVTAAGMQPARNPPTLIGEARLRAPGSLTELITANFARIDLETSRRFEEFKKSFLEILGTRVVDIREEDGAVLFLESKTMGLLWPWPNNTIQKRWREFFHAPKGENAPVRAVEQPAVLICQGDQWTLRTKGAVRQ